MTPQVKIALVEFGGSHDECLLSQMLALKSAKATIYWVTTPGMYQRCTYLHHLIDDVYFVELEQKAWGDFQKMKSLVDYLKKEDVTQVVFNTAQGGNVRNLAFLLPKSISAYGIIHTLRKFNGSFTQRLINRKIKKYFVLSDDLLKRTQIPTGLEVKSFYPLDFPHFTTDLMKNPEETWITLTGGVETRRKDLSSMLDIILRTPANTRYIFLGKTDLNDPGTLHFLEQIKINQFEKRIIWFDSFVNQELFDAYLQKSDFLLPLIHPDTPSAEQYISNQISGAFLLSFAYHIPMLIHHAYESELDLKKSSLFYELDSFSTCLVHAIEQRSKLVNAIANEEKWKAGYQYRNYLRFISVS